MKITDLEDAERLVYKPDLLEFRLEFQQRFAGMANRFLELETRILKALLDHERQTRTMIFEAYGMIVGTYVLIIGWVLANHFWK